jgi:hypothetical protein
MGTTTFATTSDGTSDGQRQAADERREALNWLSRRLRWENRLGQLRPRDPGAEPEAERKQAA